MIAGAYMKWLKSQALLLGFCVSIQAANGFSVSVTYGPNELWSLSRGSLLRYQITSNKVTSCDTLHSKANGFAYYPAINFAGAKVAFYRWGTPSTIAVVDLTTKVVTNLCNLPVPPAREMGLDWMTDDWIYYVIPQGPTDPNGDPEVRENVDIWRVNAVTKVNEKYVYINDGRNPMPDIPSGWGPMFPAFIRRFSVSLDGTRAGIQGVNWGWNCNACFCFPPPGGNVNSTGCPLGTGGMSASCNISLSCSGGYCAGYFAGWHDNMMMGKLPGANGPAITNLQLNTIESWLGQDVGQGAELIRWAANSDKWVLQQIAWSGLSVDQGSNQVIANWVDHQAIRTSQNSSSSHLSNCTGDFWVDGGAANAGKYEGADGVWRTVNVAGTRSSGIPDNKRSNAADGSKLSRLILENRPIAGDGMAYSIRGQRIGNDRIRNTGIIFIMGQWH